MFLIQMFLIKMFKYMLTWHYKKFHFRWHKIKIVERRVFLFLTLKVHFTGNAYMLMNEFVT